jgi:hypothetical protein
VTPLDRLLDTHLLRYPLLQAADVYKLLHQSVFGPGHIISSAAAARQYLVEELSQLAATGEAEVEGIDPAGLLVRVNLRPLAGRDGVVDRLVDALVRSARLVRGSTDEMSHRLAAALDWCRERLPAGTDELTKLSAEAGASGFPARHHSSVYLEHYRPAYRVVLRELWLLSSNG